MSVSTTENEIVEFAEKPVLYECSSANEVRNLVELSKKAGNGAEFVLLLDCSKKVLERVLPAYLNAVVRVGEGIARSKGIQIEMLLLISGTMNIGKALEECGAKRKQKFLVFATSKEALDRFAKKNGMKVLDEAKQGFDLDVASDVAMTELLSE